MQPDSLSPGYSVQMHSEDTLTLARRMDAGALSRLHDRHFTEIYRYVRYRIDDDVAAEDISAEVFVRLLDALHKQRGPDLNVRGWLYGTASNLVNDHLRRRYHRPEASLEDQPHLAGEADPGKDYETSWEQEQVRKALRRLTEEQQHVLALRFTEEHNLEDTAALMGKSVTAVKALQFRAVAALRRLLEQVE